MASKVSGANTRLQEDLRGPGTALLLAVLWIAGWALFPPDYDWFGAMGSCGAPALSAFSRSSDLLARHCQQGGLRNVAVAIVGGGLLAASAVPAILRVGAGYAPRRRWGRFAASLAGGFLLAVLAVAGAAGAAKSYGSHTPTQRDEFRDFEPTASASPVPESTP